MAKRKAGPPETPGALEVRREKGKIWSHVRRRWLAETPEERVRQPTARLLLALLP